MGVNYFGKYDTVLLIQLINAELQKYVKAVEGKGLSTEDFTSAFKTKLDDIDLTKYYTKEEINTTLSGITGIKFEKPEGGILPESGKDGVIYLIQNDGAGSNVYDEYFWDSENSKFELFGTTSADLTGYLKESDVKEIPTTEIQAAWDAVFGE